MVCNFCYKVWATKICSVPQKYFKALEKPNKKQQKPNTVHTMGSLLMNFTLVIVTFTNFFLQIFNNIIIKFYETFLHNITLEHYFYNIRKLKFPLFFIKKIYGNTGKLRKYPEHAEVLVSASG